MILKLVRTPGIYLVGFMGSGKSTVGRLLAERLGWEFTDLDQEIEAAQGKSIASIFAESGEAHFRSIETEAIRTHMRIVRSGRPLVMALGGGAFVQPGNPELLSENGVTIWLECPVETAWRRVGLQPGRPLAQDEAKFRALYEARRPFYAQAEFHIEAGCETPEEPVERICSLPIFR